MATTENTAHERGRHEVHEDGAGEATPFNLCRLDYLGVVSLTGRDAATFLHNQVSNDIEDLGENESILAAYCNPKGRVIALFRVLRTGETDYALLMAADLVEPVVKRLRMFILRSKVAIEPMAATVVYALPGDPAVEALAEQVPETGSAVALEAGWLLATGTVDRRFLFVSKDGTPPNGMAVDASEDRWLGLMATDAMPEVFASTTETFLPQALNLDLVGALNFRKGCYPGQEIVARLRYLGKLKQRMVRVSFDGEAPAPGAAVFAGDRKIGQLVLSGTRGESRVGLVSLSFAQLDASGLAFENGTALSISLPDYEVPELTGETDGAPRSEGQD